MRTAHARLLAVAFAAFAVVPALFACGGQVTLPGGPGQPVPDGGVPGPCENAPAVSCGEGYPGIGGNCTSTPVCISDMWSCETVCSEPPPPPPIEAGVPDVIVVPPTEAGTCLEPAPDCKCGYPICANAAGPSGLWVCSGDCVDGGYPDVIILPPPWPPSDGGACFGNPPLCLDSCGNELPSFCDSSDNWACPSTGPCDYGDASIGVGFADAGTVGVLPP
jgi:hypothetical protein